MGHFCADILQSYPVPPNGVDAASYIFGLLQIISMPLILYFIKSQADKARMMGKMSVSVTDQEAESAASNTIFPVLVWWLQMAAMANLAAGVPNLFLPIGNIFNSKSGSASIGAIVIYPLAVFFYHFVLEGIAVLLCQRGVGRIGQRRALLWGFISGTYSATFVFITLVSDEPVNLISWLFLESSWTIFYGLIWLLPERFFFRRPAAIILARFWTILRVMSVISIGLAVEGEDFGFCMYFVCEAIGFGLLKNFVIYYVLLIDSRWWQGTFANAYKSGSTNLTDPLLGIDLKLDIAQQLAANIDSMQHSIVLDDHRSNKWTSEKTHPAVNVLNFAYLQLDKKKLIGVGGTSKVYMGTYKGVDVAVKLLFVIDVTRDLVQRVVAEAQLLSRFNGCESVVRCHGVVVLPPCIAMVLEWCEKGSLYDVVQAGNTDDGGRKWNWKERVKFCWGAAQGIHTLHRQGICHRDLKSMNFLVTKDLAVRVTDLDLADDDWNGNPETTENVQHLECLNWVPPESLIGKPYRGHGDIYALSMVFSEICSGVVPWSEFRDPQLIRERVLKGQRPVLPGDTPTELKNLIELMWDKNPRNRPKSIEVVETLSKLLEMDQSEWIKFSNDQASEGKMLGEQKNESLLNGNSLSAALEPEGNQKADRKDYHLAT